MSQKSNIQGWDRTHTLMYPCGESGIPTTMSEKFFTPAYNPLARIFVKMINHSKSKISLIYLSAELSDKKECGYTFT